MAHQGGRFVPAEKVGTQSCAPFETDVQSAVQRDGEGEGEKLRIAAQPRPALRATGSRRMQC
eukprot:1105574-Prymnesium_polylepis.1